MHIAVVHNTENFDNDYAQYIYLLLEMKAIENGYKIFEWKSSLQKEQQNKSELSVTNIINNSSSLFVTGWWYSFILPSILKKINATVLINLDAIIHPSITIHQTAVINDDAVLKDKKQCANAVQVFAHKNFKKHKLKGGNIIMPSAAMSNTLSGINCDADFQTIYYSPLLNNKHLEWHEKLMIKAKESGNTEYFFAIIDDEEETFMLLMKAFSKFKKWQQSSMQFILINRNAIFSDEIKEKLSLYKYRNDVKLLEDITEERQSEIMSAAWSFIFLPQQASFFYVLDAIQTGTPVISFYDHEVKEYCGEAALYTAEKNAESLGDSMLTMYKNENIKSQKSEAGILRSLLYKKEEQAEKLWSYITKNASQSN